MFLDDMYQFLFQFAVILGFLFLVELGGSITGYVFRHKVSICNSCCGVKLVFLPFYLLCYRL